MKSPPAGNLILERVVNHPNQAARTGGPPRRLYQMLPPIPKSGPAGGAENRARPPRAGRVMTVMISAAAGYDDSLDAIRRCFMDGHASKDDFEKALRAHKEAKDEMTSLQRQAAAAARGLNRL